MNLLGGRVTEKQLLKHLGAGMPAERIAELYGVSKITVGMWIKELKKNLAERIEREKNKGP